MIQTKYAVVFPKYLKNKSLGEIICCREQTPRRKVKPKYPVGRTSNKHHISQNKSLCLCSPPSPRRKWGNTLPHILHFTFPSPACTNGTNYFSLRFPPGHAELMGPSRPAQTDVFHRNPVVPKYQRLCNFT